MIGWVLLAAVALCRLETASAYEFEMEGKYVSSYSPNDFYAGGQITAMCYFNETILIAADTTHGI